METDKIIIDPSTFEKFYGDIYDIIMDMTETNSLCTYILTDDLLYTEAGKNYYISEENTIHEIVATFYKKIHRAKQAFRYKLPTTRWFSTSRKPPT